MSTCKKCQYYQAHENTAPETGTCYGEPPKNTLLPQAAAAGALLGPGARQPVSMVLQSTRPVVTETDKACALWRGASH